MTTTVDFYLGIGSRYSYLAASQIDRIEAQTGCRFVWKPISSGVLIDRGDSPFRKATGSGQYDQAYREYDAKSWATFYGIPFHEPFAFEVDPMLPALACLAADRQGSLVACCRLFQQLIFAEKAVIDASTIAALPARLGLEEGAFRRDLEASQIRDRHMALIDEAEQRGAFGVPTSSLVSRCSGGMTACRCSKLYCAAQSCRAGGSHRGAVPKNGRAPTSL